MFIFNSLILVLQKYLLCSDRLDEVSDDEDLDLIPPKPVDNQCGPCSCVIQ